MPPPVPPMPAMHVLAGVMRDASERVLLAQRLPGKHLAGMWEFPGGKLEPGEAPFEALARELREELGVTVQHAVPLIRVPCRRPERDLLLDAWVTDRWEGTPQSLEGQALQWLLAAAIDPSMLAPADRAILQALRLPRHYRITPADISPAQRDIWFERISQAIRDGVAPLVQLRFPLWPRELVRELAADLLPLAHRHGVELLLNADIEGAAALGAGVGVHLKSVQLDTLPERPLPWHQRVAASCHDAAQLDLAAAIGADFATLSPVCPTRSHPQASPLGWARFHELAEAAALPVYALGGLTSADFATAQRHAGQGVAGIRGFWS